MDKDKVASVKTSNGIKCFLAFIYIYEILSELSTYTVRFHSSASTSCERARTVMPVYRSVLHAHVREAGKSRMSSLS